MPNDHPHNCTCDACLARRHDWPSYRPGPEAKVPPSHATSWSAPAHVEPQDPVDWACDKISVGEKLAATFGGLAGIEPCVTVNAGEAATMLQALLDKLDEAVAAQRRLNARLNAVSDERDRAQRIAHETIRANVTTIERLEGELAKMRAERDVAQRMAMAHHDDAPAERLATVERELAAVREHLRVREHQLGEAERRAAHAVQRAIAAEGRAERLEGAVRDVDRAMRAVHRALPGEEVRTVIAASEAITRASALLSPDPPIAHPASRAKAVAEEIRRRGIWADVSLMDADEVPVVRLRESGVDMFPGDLDGARGPRTIADEIQREEAVRAEKWARGE